MIGYDSPEMRPSRSLKNRDEIKKKALESKEYLKSLIHTSKGKIRYDIDSLY